MSLHGPRDLALTIRHQEPKFQYRAVGIMGMSTPFVEEREFTTEGKPTAAPGELMIEGRWEGTELVVRYAKKGRAVGTVRMAMSPDGKRLTRRIELAGKAPILETYSRQ